MFSRVTGSIIPRLPYPPSVGRTSQMSYSCPFWASLLVSFPAKSRIVDVPVIRTRKRGLGRTGGGAGGRGAGGGKGRVIWIVSPTRVEAMEFTISSIRSEEHTSELQSQ